MIDSWLFYLAWTVAGSALGGLARYGLSREVALRCGEDFPVGTLVVNTIGAFLIGGLAFLPWGQMLGEGIGEPLRLFLIFGFLGGFTTVSSFSLQTLELLQKGRFSRAWLNLFLSVGLCLAAVAAGAALAQIIL